MKRFGRPLYVRIPCPRSCREYARSPRSIHVNPGRSPLADGVHRSTSASACEAAPPRATGHPVVLVAERFMDTSFQHEQESLLIHGNRSGRPGGLAMGSTRSRKILRHRHHCSSQDQFVPVIFRQVCLSGPHIIQRGNSADGCPQTAYPGHPGFGEEPPAGRGGAPGGQERSPRHVGEEWRRLRPRCYATTSEAASAALLGR